MDVLLEVVMMPLLKQLDFDEINMTPLSFSGKVVINAQLKEIQTKSLTMITMLTLTLVVRTINVMTHTTDKYSRKIKRKKSISLRM